MRRNKILYKKKKRFRFLKFIIIFMIVTIIPLKLGSCVGNQMYNMHIEGEDSTLFTSFLNKFNIFKKEEDIVISKNAFAIDRENQKIIFSKNENKRAYPASLTKIMTTIVALENIEDLSGLAPVDIATYRLMVENNASMAGFYGKEMVTYRDLLYGTILSSGGEAANSLAINISSTREDFVKLMNEKAKSIGMKDTNFTNPEGLHDDNQYTTAKDMSVLLDYALSDGNFRAIFTKKEFITTKTLDHPKGVVLRSTVLNNIEEREDYSILGGKSGTTKEAGQCWATLGIKDEKEYIVITMDHPLEEGNPFGHKEDTLKIFDYIK